MNFRLHSKSTVARSLWFWLVTAVAVFPISTTAAVDDAAATSPDACDLRRADIGFEQCREVVEDFLLRAAVVSSQRLKTGITRSNRLTLRLGDIQRRAIFKTVNTRFDGFGGVRRRPAAFLADSYKNEIAAYRIAAMVGLDTVPVTVLREIDGRKGSLQIWVENAVNLYYFSDNSYPAEASDQLQRPGSMLQVFDTLICNDDRNTTNILYVADRRRIWLIDHSRAFGTKRVAPSHVKKARPVLSSQASHRLAALSAESLRREVGGLLSASQIRAVMVRRDRILKFWPAEPAAE